MVQEVKDEEINIGGDLEATYFDNESIIDLINSSKNYGVKKTLSELEKDSTVPARILTKLKNKFEEERISKKAK